MSSFLFPQQDSTGMLIFLLLTAIGLFACFSGDRLKMVCRVSLGFALGFIFSLFFLAFFFPETYLNSQPMLLPIIYAVALAGLSIYPKFFAALNAFVMPFLLLLAVTGAYDAPIDRTGFPVIISFVIAAVAACLSVIFEKKSYAYVTPINGAFLAAIGFTGFIDGSMFAFLESLFTGKSIVFILVMTAVLIAAAFFSRAFLHSTGSDVKTAEHS